MMIQQAKTAAAPAQEFQLLKDQGKMEKNAPKFSHSQTESKTEPKA